jgi:hypothetical protein
MSCWPAIAGWEVSQAGRRYADGTVLHDGGKSTEHVKHLSNKFSKLPLEDDD